ncbi:4-(cytidine 5'-diphospho)-2-C-methyl-D-erythritol kinase [Henriciella sp.]|uniref:4-(cytidine 5'-diphospho)-2-C-methyl-D-erythritol kinase n=1 Tax=Henriciella sp. TaxID=1968823 RepID=UPI0026368931|nr:4-(cytidine 5'-diphospho)-2-C-methyl-D-erythritol kinase [Henriciella sp.]
MLAPAKVNLFLHVGPVKENGRHDLDSLVMFAGPEAADRLDARKAAEPSLTLHGDFATPDLATTDNLVVQALAACETRGLRVPSLAISLHKDLPVAAGLGGGSADAGAMLRILVRLGTITPPVAMTLAASLGGDVPVAFLSRPALMRGEGEKVIPVHDLPELPVLLVNPGLACPTGPVFRAFDEAGASAPLDLVDLPELHDVRALAHWLESETRNDLQAPAIQRVPEIAGVLDELAGSHGCLLARLSGSGASCFALFHSRLDLKAASDRLKARHPGWWVAPSLLGGSGTG